MKKVRSILIAALLFTAINQKIVAQTKVAHIDVRELMTEMPEMKAANIQLEKLSKANDSQYTKMVEDFKTKAKKYDTEAPTTTNAIKNTRTTEMLELREKIELYRETSHKEFETKQEETFKPIVEKARKAIQKVGKAKGYQYVLDSTEGTDLFLADGPDILIDVKKELGF